MRSNYKRLGKYIRQIDVRNTENKTDNLLGVSVQKCFIPSIANTVGTDFSKYKVVKKGQFTYIPDTSRRGDKIGIALLNDYDEGLVSNVYTVFEIIDEKELDPTYLMLWFNRPEFDRYARFKSQGSVREVFDWDEMCNVELPVPSYDEQRKIVDAYKAIERRIELKKKINDNLEAQSQALLTKTVCGSETISTSLGDIVDFIDGDRGKNYPTFDEFSDTGYCLFLNASNVTSTGFSFDTCQFITKEKDEALRKGHLSRGDIVLTSRGTLGNVAYYNNYIPFNNARINSGMLIIRPKTDRYAPVLLFTLLKSGYMKAAIESLKSGSAQPQLPIKDLQKAQFEIPTNDSSLQQLSIKLSYIDNCYSENCLEIMALKNMSMLLLSELSSR